MSGFSLGLAGYVRQMAELKKRIVAGILAAAMVLTVSACDGDDDPDSTTPEDTTTTQPVGS